MVRFGRLHSTGDSADSWTRKRPGVALLRFSSGPARASKPSCVDINGRMGHATRDGTSPRCRYVPACTRLLHRSSPHGNYSVLAPKCYQTTRTFEPTAITRTSGKLPRLGRHRARMGLFKDSLEVSANPCRRRSRWTRLGARSGRRDVDGLDQASQPAFFVLAKSPGSISCAS